MPSHRTRAQNARERIRKLTESSKKARLESGAKESASWRASDDSSYTDLLDETVIPAFKITLNAPYPASELDSALTHAAAVPGSDRAPGSAATPQVISDMKAEKQTGGPK